MIQNTKRINKNNKKNNFFFKKKKKKKKNPHLSKGIEKT
jgi:hypothetical protein